MRALAIVLVAMLVVIGRGWAADLYEGRAIVTGTDDRQRLDGFDRCLRDVLVKVSGNPGLATDPRIAEFEPQAEALAEDFDYQDRMSDAATHDEQGTRDRPFDLSVRFAPARIDAVLGQLGIRPWRADLPSARPALGLLVHVAKNGDAFALTADGLAGERMREAAMAAGRKYGMRVMLPPMASPETMPAVSGAVPVHGTLIWSPQDYGWVGSWRVDWQGREHQWSISGVSFDEAFRDAVRGAMQVLATGG